MEDVQVSQARNRVSLRLKQNLVDPKAKVLIGQRETYAPHTYGHLRSRKAQVAQQSAVGQVAGCGKGFSRG